MSVTGWRELEMIAPLSRRLVAPLSPTLLLALVTCAHAANSVTFEGFWAKGDVGCDSDVDSLRAPKTRIDMRDPQHGAVFDQRDNHCRVTGVVPRSQAFQLFLSCYRSWDAFARGSGARSIAVAVMPRGHKFIVISGVQYVRCEPGA
jgi:hypothetical protein